MRHKRKNHSARDKKPGAVIQQRYREYFWQLEFLCRPKTGYIPRFLSSGELHEFCGLKQEMLKFLTTMFSHKGNPFVRLKIYIETFISEHYLMFLKQYNAPLMHQDILTLCDLHLQILFAFSQTKEDRVKRKFYQLRTIDFLVRQISLEYEIILKKTNWRQNVSAKNSPSPKTTAVEKK